MKKLEVVIRKFDKVNKRHRHPSLKNLNKQILTLHRKLKKNDKIYTEYSIEKDKDKSKYHVHLLIHYNNEQNLYNELSRHIGGTDWTMRENGLETFNECNGTYGLVHTEPVRNELQYRKYINKHQLSKTLI